MEKTSVKTDAEKEIQEQLEQVKAIRPNYFSHYITNISEKRCALMKKFKCNVYSENVVPRIENEAQSCVFCLGREVCKIIYPDEKVHANIQCKPPLLSVVLHLSQHDFYVLLKHMFKWYKSIGLSDLLGKWFFAVLICIERPTISYILRYVDFLAAEFTKDFKIKSGEESVRLYFVQKLITSTFYLDRYHDMKKLLMYHKLTRKNHN